MTPKKAAVLMLLISIFFAVMIVLADFFLEGSSYSGYSEEVRYLLIGLWFIPFAYLTATGVRKKLSTKH